MFQDREYDYCYLRAGNILLKPGTCEPLGRNLKLSCKNMRTEAGFHNNSIRKEKK